MSGSSAWLAAQDIVREIYLFRARAGAYKMSSGADEESPRQRLASKLKKIHERTVQGDLRDKALPSYEEVC